ncbi:BRCA1-associated protein 2 [Folsomia candida]|uniref:BRCA1-associated protein 2 n=1 Tax=Folsomia candida TaxID=158441 RepID=A0A226DCV8_FOLCA|nr:BRCA1-associated protein 2 [Folsomia candida]
MGCMDMPKRPVIKTAGTMSHLIASAGRFLTTRAENYDSTSTERKVLEKFNQATEGKVNEVSSNADDDSDDVVKEDSQDDNSDLELTLKALEAARHEDERKVASLQAKLTQARNALEALKIESPLREQVVKVVVMPGHEEAVVEEGSNPEGVARDEEDLVSYHR